jgi:hypothetical protein
VSDDPAVERIIAEVASEGVAEGPAASRAAQLARDITPIDWSEFWRADTRPEEWVIEPVVPAHRQVAIYAKPKLGKSLLALDISAAFATGRSVLGYPARPARSVVYLDLEMTEDDIRERLVDFGYGQNDDLSRLAYYQLPMLPPLDTKPGGEVLQEIVGRHSPELVVIDTMARVVTGDENDADTYRRFYANTGVRLKRRGIALLRLDHAGKDLTRGQRGSSSKADDVDVVFALSLSGDNVVVTCTHSRVPWVPSKMVLRRETDPALRHVLSSDSWPAGTKAVADILDELGVPLDASFRAAQEAIRQATGKGRRTQDVTAALKWRRVQSESGNTGGNASERSWRETKAGYSDKAESSQVSTSETLPGNTRKQPPRATGNVCPSKEGHMIPSTVPVADHEDYTSLSCSPEAERLLEGLAKADAKVGEFEGSWT